MACTCETCGHSCKYAPDGWCANWRDGKDMLRDAEIMEKVMRQKQCCYQCPDRNTHCHSDCPKYLKYADEQAQKREKHRQQSAARAAMIGIALRNKKRDDFV